MFQPQQPLLNYTVEAIGTLCCTNDGIYLVGGALSGNVYIWDVCISTLKAYFLSYRLSVHPSIFLFVSCAYYAYINFG